MAFSILIPLVAKAQIGDGERGRVTVNVYNQDGEPYVGHWYLHLGTTKNNRVIRNGLRGKSVNLEWGDYYLDVWKVEKTGQYYLIHSENPQRLLPGEEITFNVQYFKTEEQYERALNPIEPLAATEPEPTPAPTEEPEIADEEPTTEEPIIEEITPEPASYVDPYAELRAERERENAIAFNRLLAEPEVETIETESREFEGTLSLNAGERMELAVTGNPLLTTLLVSMGLGALTTRRRRS